MPKLIEINSYEEKDGIVSYLKTGSYPMGLNKIEKRSFRRKASNFSIVGDFLCFNKSDETKLRAIFQFETESVQLILSQEHIPGHPGIKKK